MKNKEKIIAKIQKTAFGSYQFKLVINKPINGTNSNQLVKTIVSFLPFRLSDNLFRIYAWNKVESTLNDLYSQKLMSLADIAKARQKFNKFLPKVQAVRPESTEQILINELLARV
jgi:hypothetical protein